MAVLGFLSSWLHKCFKSGLYLKRDPGIARLLAAQFHPGLYTSSFGFTTCPKKPAQAWPNVCSGLWRIWNSHLCPLIMFSVQISLEMLTTVIYGKKPCHCMGRKHPQCLTKRLKASLVFWKQSMNSASLGGLARRVSMPSFMRRWRERHFN